MDTVAVGLSRTETLVAAALSRRPLGLRSVRAVARAGAVSPAGARRALSRLERAGLVVHERRRFVEGPVVTGDLWRDDVTSPRWSELAPLLGSVVFAVRPAPPAAGVPRRLAHLFWNADVSRLDPVDDGPYLAARLLLSGDPQALAWAATNLSASALRSVVGLRGVSPDRRALAENLAAAR